MRVRSILSLVVVVLAGGVCTAEEMKSGPQPGEGISGRFDPVWLNGDPRGGNHCPV
jgi:hypothetical protein